MLKNYFKIAFRNLGANKTSSIINISGLAVGMAVAILIGLWIWDELSFNKNFANYHQVAQVMQNVQINGEVVSGSTLPHPLGDELRKSYGSDFKNISMTSFNYDHILSFGEKKFSKSGSFMEPDVLDMLSIKMVKGTKNALADPLSLILSSSLAKVYFGDSDPIGKAMILDNKYEVKVTGVYEDISYNSSFADVGFISTWALYGQIRDFKNDKDPWRCNCFLTYVQVAENTDMKKVSAKIRDVKLNKINKSELIGKPQLFLFPMSRWHLYSEFKNGINAGGRIQYVWLFGIIGLFVLLLACINFMNLSTARSEKRSKEVGIRKSIGSLRSQLITQFYSESLLVSILAFILSLFLTQLALTFFNDVAGKKMILPWNNFFFWVGGFSFSIFTGLLAGSYPALYLSSFNPVKVLKGTFRVGRFAALPRKILVVLQFTVSVILIIGTVVVYRQIQFAQNRPIGYNRDGLVQLQMLTTEIHNHLDVVRGELIKNGAIVSLAEAGSPTTAVWSTNSGFDWKGKEPSLSVEFPNTDVSYDYGKTIGWQFVQGRDFSREYSSDTMSFILTESAVKFMNLKNPIGEIVKWDGYPFKVIGVIKDMVVESPYASVRPSLYHLTTSPSDLVIAKINPNISAADALGKIQSVFLKYNPSQPFDYKFVDEEYAKKFGNEQRIGKLATVFAGLAIFISCLGLFGMASFVAEQRIKEIGIRKVLGASVFSLWQLLSKDFVGLVIISLVIAGPAAYYFMNNWLLNYEYRTEISWWIFASAGIGAFVITIFTISFQAIKAALANPVKSLRTE